MLIDVHTHAQPPDYFTTLLNSGRYEVERGPDEQLIVKDRGARFITITERVQALTPAERLAEMDALGVGLQVLSLPAPGVFFLEGQAALDLARRSNDYLADMVQQAPDRFRALAAIPLTANIDSAIAELVRCLDTLGMPGFLIGGNVNGIPLDDSRFDPFYEEANRRGAIMFVHPMSPPGLEAMTRYALAPVVGFTLDITLAVARLIFSNFFGRFLNIDVVAAHLGGSIPYIAGQLDDAWNTFPECQDTARPPSEVVERLYLETAAASESALRMALDCVGPERVVFGSDYPDTAADVADTIATIRHTAARRDRGKVLGDNAARLYGITT